MTRSPVIRRVALVALLLAQRRQGTSSQRARRPIVTAIWNKREERGTAATPSRPTPPALSCRRHAGAARRSDRPSSAGRFDLFTEHASGA